MRVREIEVFIEYRMKAGESIPRWKCLRARVRSSDADGFVFGKDLLTPSCNYGIGEVVTTCLKQLCSKSEYIRFTFDEVVKQSSLLYHDGVPLMEMEVRKNKVDSFCNRFRVHRKLCK